VNKNRLTRLLDRFWPASKADIDRLIMKTSELQGALDTLKAQLAKATKEIVDEIANLKTQIGDADLPQGAVDSLANLQTLAQALDDLNPDPPATTEPAPVTPPPVSPS
jgi:hypothetical protein